MSPRVLDSTGKRRLFTAKQFLGETDDSCCCAPVPCEAETMTVTLTGFIEECLACYAGSPNTRLKPGSLAVDGTYTATKIPTGGFLPPPEGNFTGPAPSAPEDDCIPGVPGSWWMCAYQFTASNVATLNLYATAHGVCPDISENAPPEDQRVFSLYGKFLVRCDGVVLKAYVEFRYTGLPSVILVSHLDPTTPVAFGDPIYSNGDQTGVDCSPESIALGNVRYALGGYMTVEESPA